MKKLKDLLHKAGIEELIGPSDPLVSMIHFDSRKVSGEDLFIAIRGTVTDGHIYIREAIEQ